jgi:hypothetical protein
MSQQDRIDAERYRALRDFRKEYMPYFWYDHRLQIKWFKVPSTDYECDEAVDQMIERYRSYVE